MDVNMVDKDGEEEVALSPAERVSAMYLNSHLADVYFIITHNDGTTSRLPAHKWLLSTVSDTFCAQFFGSVPEQSEVQIGDECIDTDTFKLLLKHIYLRHIELSRQQAPKLLYLAKKYLMKSLVNVCKSFVVEQLAEYSDWCLHLLQYLHAALGDSEPTLMQRVMHLIDVNGNAAVSSAQFECLSAQLVSLIVQRDALHVDEVTLFTMVIKWSQRECERRGLPVTLANQRAVLQDILPHVRFTAVSRDEFCSMMRVSRILSADMIADIVTAEDKATLPFNSQPRIINAHNRVLYIIGGKTVKMYSLDNGCQVTQMQMNEQRSNHCAAYCSATKQIMVIGGLNSGTEMSAEMCTVSDNTPAFTTMPLTDGRMEAVCICIEKKIFVIGGAHTKTCVCYDVTLGTWTDLAPLPYRVSAASCVVYEDGGKTTILVIGGFKTGAGLDTVLQYTPGSNQWIARADLQLPKPLFLAAAVNWNGTVVVLGGRPTQGKATNECYSLDMHATVQKWVSMPPLKTKRHMHEAVELGDKIVVMGGRDEHGHALKSVEVYDGVQWTSMNQCLPSLLWSSECNLFQSLLLICII